MPPCLIIYPLIATVFASGALGGIVSSLLGGTRNFWPCHDEEDVWRLGWFGNTFIGGIAAVVIWGIYGPLASFDLVTPDATSLHLTIAQMVTSLVIGAGGVRILTSLIREQILRAQRNEYESAADDTAATLRQLTNQQPDEPDAPGQSEGQPPP